MGFLVLLILCIAIYFLPAIIGRDKDNAGAIFLLNFLLGWTLVGWVIALVWAVTVDPPKPIAHTTVYDYGSDKKVVTEKVDRLDQLKKLKDLLDSQAITEQEYNNEKAKILAG